MKYERRKIRVVTDVATSRRMAAVRQQNTKPETSVRRLLHKMGHRYRVENRDLPGSPDVANRRKRWAIFVHGCFWHRHPGCAHTTTPKRNRAFWQNKFRDNVDRDERVIGELKMRGLDCLIIWECETSNEVTLRRKLRDWFRDRACPKPA